MNTNSSRTPSQRRNNPYQESEIERCPRIPLIQIQYLTQGMTHVCSVYTYMCVVSIEKGLGLAEMEIKGFLYAARVLKKITI